MEFLANLLSTAAVNASSDSRTVWLTWDEPECPQELL